MAINFQFTLFVLNFMKGFYRNWELATFRIVHASVYLLLHRAEEVMT